MPRIEYGYCDLCGGKVYEGQHTWCEHPKPTVLHPKCLAEWEHMHPPPEPEPVREDMAALCAPPPPRDHRDDDAGA